MDKRGDAFQFFSGTNRVHEAVHVILCPVSYDGDDAGNQVLEMLYMRGCIGYLLQHCLAISCCAPSVSGGIEPA